MQALDGTTCPPRSSGKMLKIYPSLAAQAPEPPACIVQAAPTGLAFLTVHNDNFATIPLAVSLQRADLQRIDASKLVLNRSQRTRGHMHLGHSMRGRALPNPMLPSRCLSVKADLCSAAA